MSNKNICVVGGGIMGAAVACTFAVKNYRVFIIEKNADSIEQSKALFQEDMRKQLFFERDDTLRETIENKCNTNVQWTLSYNVVSTCAFVIENIIENESLKKEVYLKLREYAKNNIIFIANTSAIPITKLGKYVGTLEKIIGIHFMNPVYMKPVAEVIVTEHTSKETIDATLSMLESIGKRGIVVKDKAGFVINRVFMRTINDAIRVLSEGTSTVEDIDDLFVNCLGHKMGPLATADLIGLDTILLTLNALQDEYDPKEYEPCNLLKEYVEKGRLGCKTNQGFYTY